MTLSTEDRELVARLRASGRLNLTHPIDFVESVTYYRQGSFTIAVVVGREGKITAGVAKRNCYTDDPNDRRGRDIALTRALRGDAKVVEP